MLYQLSYYRMLPGRFGSGAGRARGAVDGDRTRDLDLGKVALCQLSYYRMPPGWAGG